MSDTGGVSVVMVSYRTGPVLFDAIDAVLGQADLAELIVADNGNPPAVLAELGRRAERDPRLRIISGHGNVGFAAGCNLAARAAGGTWLLLLNPDCLLPPDGLSRLIAEAASRPRPWLMGPRLANPDGSEQRGSRRELLTPWTALVEVLRLDRLAPLKRLNRHRSAITLETAPVPAISGACMFLPLADYRAIGGMDEGYFLHVEDLDFCYRFRQAGGEIYHVPSVSVTHLLSTSQASPWRVEWSKAKGFIRYFRTHFRPTSSPVLLALVEAGILARFAVRGTLRSLGAHRRTVGE